MTSPQVHFAYLLASVAVFWSLPTRAQLIPDQTLGAESSIISTDIDVRGELADLIEGGAARGPNLFHSFSEFNVTDGQRVYFANPTDIESILSRVTGSNPSEIFGTLGVDGTADLFLINPNGLVFGENVLLDVEGSFYGVTTEAVGLGTGVFSARSPEQSQLLAIDPSVSFFNYLTENSRDVVNRGQLIAGNDLVLAGQNLDLQGQVAAIGNISLLATDTIQIRDTAESPFVALAGEDLLVQGNQQVDIFALNHSDSGLFSYGDLILRSDERIIGDAHYWSGGDFSVERLDGTGGELFSPTDPIIRSQGDVSLFGYIGTSLHIIAGGAVELGTAIITGPDTTGTAVAPETTPELANITLSDGTVLVIDGSARPTIDIRAGVASDVIGEPLGTLGGATAAFFSTPTMLIPPPENNPVVTNANIAVGDISITSPNGVVLLTNQYRPNSTLTDGNISITEDGVFGNGIDVRGFGGQGGEVYIDSRNDVSVINSFIATIGVGQVGDIVIASNDTVRFDATDGSQTTGAFGNIEPSSTGVGGDVRITATNLEVLNGAQIDSLVFGAGRGGDIILNIRDTARFDGFNLVNNEPSAALSDIVTGGQGQGGNVQISARNLEVLNGAQLSASGAFSSIQTNGEGQGGNVQISARNLEVLNGAQLSAS